MAGWMSSTLSSRPWRKIKICNWCFPSAIRSIRTGSDRFRKMPIIVKRAPQLELLKRASVCITHGGLNTVLESLARGVPQVAIPVAYDQPGVAARIAHHRTGVVTSLDKLTADHLSTLLNGVLDNPLYRNNARKLQRAIAEANGLPAAVDIIEESLGISSNSMPSPAQNH